jgi:hypothetical protein
MFCEIYAALAMQKKSVAFEMGVSIAYITKEAMKGHTF